MVGVLLGGERLQDLDVDVALSEDPLAVVQEAILGKHYGQNGHAWNGKSSHEHK